jgi:hypothetical protein
MLKVKQDANIFRYLQQNLQKSFMIEISNKIVSTDLFMEQFLCDLPACKGNCCVHGDAGAPLTDDEALILEREFTSYKSFMTGQGLETIANQGFWVPDLEGEKVTPLNNGKECAYVYFDKNIAFCAIEKAWLEKRTVFRKPVSCHLYPLRVSKLGNYDALNYHRWAICDAARTLGKKEKMPVFRFLKEAICRSFGEDFYNEMEKVYAEYSRQFVLKQP